VDETESEALWNHLVKKFHYLGFQQMIDGLAKSPKFKNPNGYFIEINTLYLTIPLKLRFSRSHHDWLSAEISGLARKKIGRGHKLPRRRLPTRFKGSIRWLGRKYQAGVLPHLRSDNHVLIHP
jgi:hypothetical protein